MSTHSTTLLGSVLLPTGGRTPVNVTFHYNSDDPAAVMLHFHTQDPDPIEWLFARNILQLGLDCKTDEHADVVAWPTFNEQGEAAEYNLRLSSPFGEAQFSFNVQEIANFLNTTYSMVPMGFEFERVDFDAELAELIDGYGDTL
jgi:Streptomyces sporulation and cell division protein, SsgA